MIVISIVMGYLVLAYWGNLIMAAGKENANLFELGSYILVSFGYAAFVIWAVVMSVVGLFA